MLYFWVFISSVVSVIYLFLLTKLIGCRQMSQLSMFDYVNGITIGSIAASLATSTGKEMLEPAIAMTVFALSATGLSYLSDKSKKVRGFVCGKPITLYSSGVFYRDSFKKAKLDIGEFLTQARTLGYFDLNQILLAIMEGNGKISFLPHAHSRPASPSDFGIAPAESTVFFNVIEDGKIIKENLTALGYDEKWLCGKTDLKIKDIFLAVCDKNGSLSCYPSNISCGK